MKRFEVINGRSSNVYRTLKWPKPRAGNFVFPARSGGGQFESARKYGKNYAKRVFRLLSQYTNWTK